MTPFEIATVAILAAAVVLLGWMELEYRRWLRRNPDLRGRRRRT